MNTPLPTLAGGIKSHGFLPRFIPCKMGLLLVLFTFSLFSGFLTPTTARAQDTGGGSGDYTQQVALPGTASDAENATKSLYMSLKGWAGWILLLAVVFAGILAAFGSPKAAMGVAIACIIIYGGVWVIGLIRDSLNGNGTSS
jgi:hypothetical protein